MSRRHDSGTYPGVTLQLTAALTPARGDPSKARTDETSMT
jgi:hypothetical protein